MLSLPTLRTKPNENWALFFYFAGFPSSEHQGGFPRRGAARMQKWSGRQGEYAKARAKARGFTLVELVMVMIIVGILAVAVIPRFFDRQTYDARAFLDRARAMLRYGQKVAIAQNRNVFVRLDGSSVALCFDAGCSDPVRPPSGGNSGSAATRNACRIAAQPRSDWFCEAPPNGVGITAARMFYFSPLGKPYLKDDVPPASNFTLQDIVVSGDLARHIVIEAETGYVH